MEVEHCKASARQRAIVRISSLALVSITGAFAVWGQQGAQAPAPVPAGATAASPPPFWRDCAEWIGRKGYSAHYVEVRTGQPVWTGTQVHWGQLVAAALAQPGDLVAQRLEDTPGQRVEVVDEVVRGADGQPLALRTSGMNNGRMLEPRCRVTDTFGKVSRREVPISAVAQAWRPARLPSQAQLAAPGK